MAGERWISFLPYCRGKPLKSIVGAQVQKEGFEEGADPSRHYDESYARK